MTTLLPLRSSREHRRYCRAVLRDDDLTDDEFAYLSAQEPVQAMPRRESPVVIGTCERCGRTVLFVGPLAWEDRGGFTRCRPHQMIFHRPSKFSLSNT